MKKLVFALASVAILLLTGCVTEGKTVIMNMDELGKDIEENMDNSSATYYQGFKSLNKGDILIIKDEISSITYRQDYNATIIHFASNNSSSLVFEGDLTGKFDNGDNVRIKLHIIEDKYNITYQGREWSIDLEMYKEGWDTSRHTIKMLPSDVISEA